MAAQSLQVGHPQAAVFDPDRLLCRQRVNEALNTLAAQEAIRVEYGGLRVTDLQALRSHVF